MLMTTVQLPGSAAYDLQMEMHTSTSNTDISLEREFQKYIPDLTRAHGFLYHVKDIKRSIQWIWTGRDYRVQEIKYLSHISVKFSCARISFHNCHFLVRVQNLID